jgi:hypothetical protein
MLVCVRFCVRVRVCIYMCVKWGVGAVRLRVNVCFVYFACISSLHVVRTMQCFATPAVICAAVLVGVCYNRISMVWATVKVMNVRCFV